MRAWLLAVCACSSPQRAEPPPPPVPADARVTLDAPDPPADAFETALIPPDADPNASGRGRVIVTDSDGGECGFVILDLIYFQPGSSEIQAHQQQMADAVAKAIECTTRDGSITKLEVQGHADDKERDPLRISEERALVMANFLISKGVSSKLLKVTGYGNTQPIDRRKTAAARAKNRRVAFLILERRRED